MYDQDRLSRDTTKRRGWFWGDSTAQTSTCLRCRRCRGCGCVQQLCIRLILSLLLYRCPSRTWNCLWGAQTRLMAACVLQCFRHVLNVRRHCRYHGWTCICAGLHRNLRRSCRQRPTP